MQDEDLFVVWNRCKAVAEILAARELQSGQDPMELADRLHMQEFIRTVRPPLKSIEQRLTDLENAVRELNPGLRL